MEKQITVKKNYEPPKVLHHQNVTFETAISSSTGHWEFQYVDGCWVRVFVP
ncbi:hypothetical protein [Peribacillus muralis]|uniref:hypothetical protein n=1 Tax=Peribacillus muralis TaxID=264697 RepID=UPI000AAD12D8|nr:hypothetical protein [Peribacillus muralis]